MAGDYRLDELGWYQFERLCQALLKARYGAAVEAWGGGKDFGRDAYSSGPLGFPDPNVLTPGPFVFQVKFVDGAGAAGARPIPALRAAIAGELLRIGKRVADGQWEDPAVYVLMTNVALSGLGRVDLTAQVARNLPNVRVVVVDARDLWAELDTMPRLRMAYPQILGIRDLQELIRRGPVGDVLHDRSEIDLAPVGRLLVHFADQWVLESCGFGSGGAPFDRKVKAELRLAVRVALLACDELLVPATSYFQSIECRQVVQFYRSLFGTGTIKLVSDASRWDEFFEIRSRQYHDQASLRDVYQGARWSDELMPPIVGAPESGIKALYATWSEYVHAHGIESITMGGSGHGQIGRLRSDAEERALVIPEILAGRSLIAETVAPHLLVAPNGEEVDRFRVLISEMFFQVLVQNFSAGVVTDLAYINRVSPRASIELSYRMIMVALANETELRREILHARPKDLLSLRRDSQVRRVVTSALRFNDA